MKSTSMILIANLLFEILVPYLSHASERRPEMKKNRAVSLRTDVKRQQLQSLDAGSPATVLQHAIRRSLGPDIRVIQGDMLEISQLAIGWYIGVVHTTNGARRIAIGRIAAIQADQIVVKPRSFFGGKLIIPRNRIDLLAVADDLTEIKRWNLSRKAIRSLREGRTRVRLRAPAISRQPITGSCVGLTSETIELRSGDRTHRIRLSSIDEFAVSAGRYRKTALGIKVGLLLAVAVPVAVPTLVATHIPGGTLAAQTQAEALTAGYVLKFALPVLLGSTLAGYSIKTDRWIEVSPRRLNLGIAPTQNIGLGAAVSFDF